MAIFALSGLYIPDQNRRLAKDIGRIFYACTTALAAIALYLLFTQEPFDSRFLIATGWAIAIVTVISGRLLLRGLKALLHKAGIGLRRVILIGDNKVAASIATLLEQRPILGYKVIDTIPHFSFDMSDEIRAMKPDELLMTNPRAAEEETLAAISFCTTNHLVFKYSADLFTTYGANMQVNPLAGVPVVEIKRTRLDGWGRVAKRIFDICFSLFAIILTSPITLVSAVIILLETGRPIIYKNERVGIRGKHFFTLKFRSMYQKDSTGAQFGDAGKEAEEREAELIKEKSIKSGPLYKIKNDPRITPFGNFIRRWSIDELPQFFNVLGGSMSVVGPRPHQPREVAQYQRHHKQVLLLKPGITGLAQISGRSDLSFEDEIRLDVLYIERWSLLLDLIIILKTPFALVKKREAL